MAENNELTGNDPELRVVNEPPPPPARANVVRRVTIVVLVLAVVLFVYGLFADRLTPYTDQATVQAYIVRVAPDVSGRVNAVNVIDNQVVKAGAVLFTIDSERYEIAVESAEAQLAVAGQSVGSSTAALSVAVAGQAEAEAHLVNVQVQSGRVFDLVKRGVNSKASGDQARADLHSAIAVLNQAKAEVERARENLGPQGADNPQIRQAQTALRKARRDLADSTVRAPSNGIVTNLELAVGQFAAAGQPVMTFLDSDVIWIESELRENSLEYIRVGNHVGIALDLRPGRVYPGKVESIGWGVNNREVDPHTGLPSIKNDTGWIREPQRFVVRVRFDPENSPRQIKLGSQADIIVYTNRSGITDAIGRFWIAVVSYFSYLN